MGPAIRLFSAARSVTAFAFNRPKDAAIILLIILAALLSWRLRRSESRSAELAAKIDGLPPDTKQVLTVYRNRVVTRWRDGPTRVEYRDRYLPPEGRIDLVTKVDPSDRVPEVMIRDRGFTSRLGGGVIYAGQALPLVDLKLAYWRRYSLTLGITPRFGGVGLSRHVDDFTPFTNLEIVFLAGPAWRGQARLGLGLRTNF